MQIKKNPIMNNAPINTINMTAVANKLFYYTLSISSTPPTPSKNQLGPRYEGQLILMAEPIPHPKRPPRTPSRRSSFFASDGRQRPIVISEQRGHCCAPF